MCRYGCQQISDLKPILEKHSVRLVAVGIEKTLGDFVDGHFFTGDLFVDKCLTTYKLLGLPQAGGQPQKEKTEEKVEEKTNKCQGKPAADLFKLAGKVPDDYQFGLNINTQLGGTYVVQTGGKVIMEHLQSEAGDYLENSYILKALGISHENHPH